MTLHPAEQRYRNALTESASDVVAARQRLGEANDALRERIREARAAGLPMTEIAKLAGVSRVTAYELVKRDDAESPT